METTKTDDNFPVWIVILSNSVSFSLIEMKRLFTVFLFIATCITGLCQEITGYVLDYDSKKAIQNASVFINGTSIGTLTDNFGKFHLTISYRQKLPVAVSSIGYNSIMIQDYDTSNLMVIYLTPHVYEIGEVYVYSKATPEQKAFRNFYIGKFRDEFLGTTLNSYKCRILNESDLIIKFDKNTATLSITANKPLIINNKALGYKITYYLDKFEYSMSGFSVFYIGNILFEEERDIKGLRQKTIEKRRRLAYGGSRMHFFRSLWENRLDSNGYKINDGFLTYDSLVTENKQGIKYLKNKGNINVSYYSKLANHSHFVLKSDSIYFDKSGYFDPAGINWLQPEDDALKLRMADQLPYDYRYVPGKQ